MTAEEVKRVAALARLEVSAAEAAALAGQLGEILEVIRGSLAGEGGDDDATNAPLPAADPAAAAAETAGVRGDEPGADALSAPPGDWAPGWREGFFTVPRLASHRGAGEG